MLNHDSALGGSAVSYEYFTDSFACVLDPKGGEVARGAEVRISYGDRPNDVLLQYYGFVQSDNPFDSYALPQEDLILALNEALAAGGGEGLPASAVGAVGAAGLTDPTALFALTASGADEPSLRLGRLLLHPAQASATDAGNTPLEGRMEASVRSALAAVAEARLATLPAAGEAAAYEGLPADAPRGLLEQFVGEKRRVLEASARALQQQASTLARG